MAKDYHYKVFRIVRKDGRTSSVSMNQILYFHAIRKLGTQENVDSFVQETASEWTPDKHPKCSTYVADQLELLLRSKGLTEHHFPSRTAPNAHLRNL